MAVARLKAVEDEKTASEVALGAERADSAMQQKTMDTLRGESIEAQSVEMELRNQVEMLKKEKSQAETELRATLLKLKDDLQRNEKMAMTRLKVVEDEKAALEVALGAEKANTSMQQKTMDTLRGKSIEAQSVEMELRNQVEMLKKERSQAAENGQRQTKEEKIRSGLARLVEKELREQVETLKKEKSQAAENGQRQTKEEKIRSGLARLVEKDLRNQVATLEQSRRQQADENRSLLTQLQVLQNEERHIDCAVTFGRTQGSNATASALGDGHPDCRRLRVDFFPGWEAPVGVAIVRIFKITVCT
ncbi:unnamed protein product [Ectocarpus fasciculatus]